MADATEDTTETVDEDTEAQEMLSEAVEDDTDAGDDAGDDDTQDDDTGSDSKAARAAMPGKPKAAWKPPTQAEFEAMQTKLSKVNAESAKRRTEIKDLRKQNETDTERASREADERAQARYKPTAIKANARSALLEADARPDRVGAIVPLLKLDDLEIDEEGDVTGLDAEVTRIKATYPEFFKSEEDEKPAPKKPGKLAASGKPAPPKEKAPWDIIGDRISGNA